MPPTPENTVQYCIAGNFRLEEIFTFSPPALMSEALMITYIYRAHGDLYWIGKNLFRKIFLQY